MKNKKVIRKTRRHGKRSKARAFDPVAIEVAEAFHFLKAFHKLLKEHGAAVPGLHSFMSHLITKWQEEYNVAMSKLVTQQQNLFPEIGRVLRKLEGPRGPKSGKILDVLCLLTAKSGGRPPSYKDVCHELFGSNWTASQESLVRQVARKEKFPLQRLQ